MALTERQEKAETLARELREMGAAVTSALPLADGTNLKFQILQSRAEPVLEALREGDWDANFISSGPRFELDGTTPLANVYEIDIPTPRTPVWGDRIPDFPLAEKVDPNSESVKMLKEWFRGKKAKSWR
jgi:hypothetical protein